MIMKSIVTGVCILLVAMAALLGQDKIDNKKTAEGVPASTATAVDKGAKWLVSVQGADGGWGQDGGETSNGNDVANTAVATLSLLRAGSAYRPNVERALDFILAKVEASPVGGLAVTDLQGTQIQRKLGPYIDTFLTSMLLAQVDGSLSKELNARVRKALEKTIAKIEQNQQKDGSWNAGGGWAPVLGTSMASRSLFEASRKGVPVEDIVMRRAEDYTVDALNASPRGMPAAAGVPLYQSAQAIEQLSRTEADRRRNAATISGIQAQLADSRFVEGFGSIGGEEFFSYLNVSESLQRGGGTQWKQWHSQIVQKIVNLQNNDGTWSGHHCITGRVAVTSAAILNLTVG
jgi:hypothetical protein